MSRTAISNALISNTTPAPLSRRALLTSLGLSVLLASCARLQPPSRFDAVDVSDEALKGINSFRAENGLGPVTVDRSLVSLAKDQAGMMAAENKLSHEVGPDFVTRMNEGGFKKQTGAENVGAGHANVETTLASWQRSPLHRANLLMPDAVRIGMARADAPESRYRNYWALILAGK
jgi:uncharacterized protein YkwD